MEKKFDYTNDTIYICKYKGLNMGAFSENSILENIDFETFMDNYASTGTSDLFLQQIDEAYNKLELTGEDPSSFSETERNVICLNIISLTKQGIFDNDELFGFIKMSCKDKKFTMFV